MKTFTLLLLVLFCFLLASCSQAEDDVVTEQIVSIEVISPIFPPVVGEGDLVLRLTHTASGVPIDDAYLAVKGDMDHDGMADDDALTYALCLKDEMDGQDSGLNDTLTGDDILLYKEGDDIVGRHPRFDRILEIGVGVEFLARVGDQEFQEF